MDTQATFGLDELLAHVIGDIATAVSERANESQQRRSVRLQAAAGTIMTFAPRDAVEAMLAGHCAMFHEMIVDSVHGTLRGEEEATRRATRSSIVAMDKAFGNNLARLERYRRHDAENSADVQPADARAETDIADRVRRHQSQTEPRQPAPPDTGSAIPHYSLPETIGACSEAIAARDAPDPGRFAQAGGTDNADEACRASATAQMAGLNRQARRAIGRQARKRSTPAAPAPAMASIGQARRHPNP